MVAEDKVFTGSIPEIYERYLVPVIFEPYAADLSERLVKFAPQDVLETAAGTGVLTRAVAARLPSARIVSTDLNGPMLAVASNSLPGARNIEWKTADALSLPFGDRSFDAVICQFGVMFFPDKGQGFREAKRVLRSNGRYLFNVWDSVANNEFIEVVSATLAELFPQDPPRFMERTPHGYNNPDKIRSDLTGAGFKDITVDNVAAVGRARSAQDAAIGYCQGNPLRNEIEARDPKGLERVTAAVAEVLEREFGKGPIEGKLQALVATASA